MLAKLAIMLMAIEYMYRCLCHLRALRPPRPTVAAGEAGRGLSLRLSPLFFLLGPSVSHRPSLGNWE